MLLLWIPLRQMPGLGTVANAVVVGVAADATLGAARPRRTRCGCGSALLVGGVVLNGLAGALYIGSQLGPGPRDGLMTGLARRTGLLDAAGAHRRSRSPSWCSGWLLGGVVGLGTVLYALAHRPAGARAAAVAVTRALGRTARRTA